MYTNCCKIAMLVDTDSRTEKWPEIRLPVLARWDPLKKLFGASTLLRILILEFLFGVPFLEVSLARFSQSHQQYPDCITPLWIVAFSENTVVSKPNMAHTAGLPLGVSTLEGGASPPISVPLFPAGSCSAGCWSRRSNVPPKPRLLVQTGTWWYMWATKLKPRHASEDGRRGVSISLPTPSPIPSGASPRAKPGEPRRTACRRSSMTG